MLVAKGINIETDISELLYSLFVRQPDLPANQAWDGVNQDIRMFLADMVANEHILYNETGFRTEGNPQTIIVIAWVTAIGFEFFSNNLLTQSNIKLNQSNSDLNIATQWHFVFYVRNGYNGNINLRCYSI